MYMTYKYRTFKLNAALLLLFPCLCFMPIYCVLFVHSIVLISFFFSSNQELLQIISGLSAIKKPVSLSIYHQCCACLIAQSGLRKVVMRCGLQAITSHDVHCSTSSVIYQAPYLFSTNTKFCNLKILLFRGLENLFLFLCKQAKISNQSGHISLQYGIFPLCISAIIITKFPACHGAS